MPKSDRGCFSAQRKRESVLRLLCGEELDLVSRELGVNGPGRPRLAGTRASDVTSAPGADLRSTEERRLSPKDPAVSGAAHPRRAPRKQS